MKNNKSIPEAALDLLFPPRCPGCDRVLKRKEKFLCEDCTKKVRFIREPLCMKCGKPLEEEEREYCRDCTVRRHVFVKGRAVFAYSGMAESIYRFKYKGRKEYATFYAKCMHSLLGEEIRRWNPQFLVPVPVHPSKLRKRGYNQAEVLAEALGREMEIPVRNDIVKRCRKTAPQKDLNNEQRQNNLKRAFKITGNDVKLSTIVIIDDIYTTGSTVDEVAKMLKKAGAASVYYAALAIGRGI